MAVVWSWAFGAETHTELALMGWSGVSNQTVPTTGTGKVYTYASFPGTKYSLELRQGYTVTAPPLLPSIGSVATAFRAPTSYDQNSNALDIAGNVDGDRIQIYCSNSGSGTFTAKVNGTVAGTVTLPVGNWHYISFTYDMSTTTYSAEFFANGASFGSTTNSSYTIAQTGVSVRIQGVGNYLPNGSLHGQIIGYDSGTSAADAATPIFVSRLQPNSDTSTVGTWAPSTGATNIGVTAGDPFDNLTFTQEATPSSGDNVVTEVNNLAAQLGLTPGIVRGGTAHTYSSGTNLAAFASIRDSGGAYTDGATVTPDEADTTYAYATSTGLTGSSTINVKYEVV